MKKTIIIGLVLVAALSVLAGGCIFGPDDGCIRGRVSKGFYPIQGYEPCMGKIYAVTQPSIKSSQFPTGGQPIEKGDQDYSITVDGNGTYFVCWVVDIDKDGRLNSEGDLILWYITDSRRPAPVYVKSGNIVYDINLIIQWR